MTQSIARYQLPQGSGEERERLWQLYYQHRVSVNYVVFGSLLPGVVTRIEVEYKCTLAGAQLLIKRTKRSTRLGWAVLSNAQLGVECRAQHDQELLVGLTRP